MEMDNCTHYFIIPAPNGSSSIGVCRLCGETREMLNSFETDNTTWRRTIKGQSDAAKRGKGDIL